MQSIYWTGRLLSRALWNGIASYSSACSSEQQSSTAIVSSRRHEASLVSAVCGFPKDFARSRIRRGQFGDDAWFTAKFRTTEVIGVADGVGGWRHYGIDPGEFSNFLMRTCERLVSMGRFTPTEPAGLLARSYYELLENKQPILGSSTACVIILNKETSSIYAANIGDSGFVVVRRGEVVHRSSEQQHYFNTPFQLSLPPPGHSDLVLRDSPESADTSSFGVEDGDVILLATDGVFDNVPDQLLVTEMRKIEGERDPTKIQCVANTIAWMARRLAFDDAFMSPFAQNARENGIDAIGGKPDDITVLLATVAI
ncbi:PPTC7 phosphatase, partial [Pseudoatta argentina]|uniref:Protein phosphatase n=4 Tax=Attini TaxID=143999 RepID=A0A195F5J6_9HYME